MVANKGFLKLDSLGLGACKVKTPAATCAVVLTFGTPSPSPGSRDKLLNLHLQENKCHSIHRDIFSASRDAVNVKVPSYFILKGH